VAESGYEEELEKRGTGGEGRAAWNKARLDRQRGKRRRDEKNNKTVGKKNISVEDPAEALG